MKFFYSFPLFPCYLENRVRIFVQRQQNLINYFHFIIINHDLYQNDIKTIYQNYTDYKRKKVNCVSYIFVMNVHNTYKSRQILTLISFFYFSFRRTSYMLDDTRSRWRSRSRRNLSRISNKEFISIFFSEVKFF